MGDAEIIPIGTRGRPGRGTGRAPSAAARALAKPKRPVEKPPVEESLSAGPVGTSGASSGQAPEPEPVAEEAGTPATAYTRDRGPLAGIPLGEWQAALDAAAHEVFGPDWEPQLARFLAFLRRRVTGDYTVDEYGFDPELTQRFLMAVLRPVAQKWFRIEVRGLENVPAEGGALVVSNHSGTLPVDGLMTMVMLHDHAGRSLRPLGADLVFRLPFVGAVARKGGATLACTEDAERMLRNGELVGVWPEGFKGIGKPYSERYKLQRFGRGGFVSAALRTGVPIIPLSVVGAEEIYPLVGNIPALAKVLGVPYLPITPFFPLLGPLGMIPLPSKWLMEFGEPIRTDEYDASAADDPMLVFNVTDQVRETIQQTLYSLLMQRQSVFR
ncbi:lysophospholipid acyltransferase family protein [Nocardioides sp.]|uniref:lysophospholipid acyltransferase family protein n=1 Tax=Nocardioides sp. TaxID=35761 RepID=UPI002BDA8F5B|nr:lysophospholipid acyltransferase family protein [Nocardioides sp.]HVX55199.1 lysophospholipid acyltransferase family protein [Nocardioides sp.]